MRQQPFSFARVIVLPRTQPGPQDMDQPPTVHPDDLLSEGELGSLAIRLLREMALTDPALAERLIAEGIEVEPLTINMRAA
jgi:hypothetical protein